MAKAAKIRVTTDGPYLVTGSVPLLRMVIEVDRYGDPWIWREVARYPPRDRYALCRCGHSRTKPYCDGAHTQHKFSGVETVSREPYLATVKEYCGPELKLTDRPELCVGASFCVRDAGIWNLTVHSDRPGFRELAIEEAANCPSGRLVVWDVRGNPIEPDYPPSIVITEHEDSSPGPLWVRGSIAIESADGTRYEPRNRVTLCTCGASTNQPLCDGAHLDR